MKIVWQIRYLIINKKQEIIRYELLKAFYPISVRIK